jgi:hypothetical protein
MIFYFRLTDGKLALRAADVRTKRARQNQRGNSCREIGEIVIFQGRVRSIAVADSDRIRLYALQQGAIL